MDTKRMNVIEKATLLLVSGLCIGRQISDLVTRSRRLTVCEWSSLGYTPRYVSAPSIWCPSAAILLYRDPLSWTYAHTVGRRIILAKGRKF